MATLKRTGGPFGRHFVLAFGEGYNPLQWLTAMFMHMDIFHLVGNMIFLWSFGLVLEGKLGNFVFPAIYVATGIVQAIIVQTLMFFSDGAALGASGAIFSMLAMVVVFAPVNSFEVFLLLGWRALTFEMPILGFGTLYVLMNIAFFFIGGATMSSEMLHLIGFAVGLPVGFVMLTRGLVDCEGYDIISYWQNNLGKSSTVGKKQRRARQRAKAQREHAEQEVQQLADQQLIAAQIGDAIARQKFDAAVALHRRLQRDFPGTQWDQSQLMTIVKGYIAKNEFDKAATLVESQIESSATNRFGWQCNLIRIWLQQQRPRHALRYLQGLNMAFHSPEEQQKLKQLAAHAKQQINSGVQEFMS